MTNKNPYENQDSIEIPQFQNKKDDSVDISLFKTKEALEEDEFSDEDYEDIYEEERRNKIILIVGVVVCALLAAGLIFALVFANSKSKEYDAIYNEYQAYVTQSTKKEADYKQSIADLEKQVAELQAELEGQKEEETKGTEYVCVQDGNVNIRKEASTSSDKTGVVYSGQTVIVYETKIQSGYTWGRIDDGWVVLKDTEGTSWFEAK